MPTVHTRTCHLCEAMCGLLVTVDGDRVTDIRGDKDDVLSRGHLCPKGPALAELWADPDRLRHPVRRTASGAWERVTWDAALDEAAARLGAIQRAHGKDALGIYLGNPSVHGHGVAMVMAPFLRALRTKNRFDANSQDANPKLLAAMLMYGDQLSLTVPDVDRTDYLLALGANPAASNGSLMSLGDVRGRLQAIRSRGGRVVLLDPRRTESAAWADEHHFIRPGSDAALLAAIVHVLFAEQLVDERARAEEARGLDEVRAIARRFSPERVSDAVGMTSDTIRRLARELARAERAVVYGRVGTCQNPFGSIASWLVETINLLTGHFDRPGGAMFASPAVDVAPLARRLVGNSYGRWRSRVRGLPELGGQLPASVMAEEMETPGDGQVRGFITVAGNPVLSTANGARLEAALGKLDFYVAVDPYINATTRHAHLILPPSHAFARSHYDVVLHQLAVRNTAKYSAPIFERDGETREDFDILYDLGMRLGTLRFGLGPVDGAVRAAWKLGLRPRPDHLLDLVLRAGPRGARPWKDGLSLAHLRRHPHGVDLGALEPQRAARVRTSDGKVDLAPAAIVSDVPRLERWLDEPPAELVLIGRRHVRSNNSWMHNCHSLVKGPSRSSLLMHPDDVAGRGLHDGQAVRIASRTGAVTARLEASDSVMRGVVSLPHGFGHGAAKDTLRRAGTLEGASANLLTDENFLDLPSGTAALNGVPVTVESLPS